MVLDARPLPVCRHKQVAGVGVTASVVAETGNVLTVEVHNPAP